MENEPWRCTGCKQFIYNTTIVETYDAASNVMRHKTYPAPGAPLPKRVNDEYPDVCDVCYSMHTAADTNYFRTVDAERISTNHKLASGGNYFS